MKTFLLILVGLAVIAQAEPAASPELIAPGGGWWRPKNRVTVKEKLVLPAAVHIDADEIQINAPLFTQGEKLDVYTRVLRFGPTGKIEGFENAAPDGTVGGAHGGPGRKGDDNRREGGRCSGYDGGGDGATGATGNTGNPGIPGKGGGGTAPPAPVQIFTAEVFGDPVIHGVGQKGGKGGQGGTGQNGGNGGQGKKANCKFWGHLDCPGTRGGNGGSYGRGGMGGVGGEGGAPIPIAFLLPWAEKNILSFPNIVSEPGDGGIPGEPGAPGAPGGAGPGGEDESCVLGLLHTPGGAPGAPGDACPCPAGDVACAKTTCSDGSGSSGSAGSRPLATQLETQLKHKELLLIRSFNEFERKRFAVSVAFFSFHWQRMLEVLMAQSLNLLDDMKVSPEEAAIADPASELLRKNIRREVVASVQRAWEVQLLNPLKAAAARYESNPVIKQRVDLAISQTNAYVKTIATLQDHEPTKQTVENLHAVFAGVSESRKKAIKEVVSSCETFAKDVLLSPTYKTYLENRQYYFEVPACSEAASFLRESQVMRPILLVRDIELSLTESVRAKLQIETGLGAAPVGESVGASATALPERTLLARMWDWLVGDAWAGDPQNRFSIILLDPKRLTADDINASTPKLNHAAGDSRMGILKGYQVPPATSLTLQSLLANLKALALMGVR